MIVNSTRLGQLEMDERSVITFPRGVLGFPRQRRYVLIQPQADSCFWWLQSCDNPDLAFVVTDPSYFVPSYRVPIRQDQAQELDLESLDQAQVLVIVNRHDQMLTGNLQGPLVIHLGKRIGVQLVLSDRRFTTRVPLVELRNKVEALSA